MEYNELILNAKKVDMSNFDEGDRSIIDSSIDRLEHYHLLISGLIEIVAVLRIYTGRIGV